MKSNFKNAILGFIFALCCVFAICTCSFMGVEVKATENENEEEVDERVELYTFSLKDEKSIIVLRLYDNDEYHLLIYDLKTKFSEKEDGTYKFVSGYVVLVSNEGKETITTVNKDTGRMTRPVVGMPPDANCKHVEIVIDEKEATCLEEGSTWGVKCKLCGGILHKPEVLPKLDHMFEEWVLRREATPTLKGLRERTCTICKTKETKEFDYVASNYKVIGEYKMTLKTKELATLKLYNNNSCEITINKIDLSIFKVTLNYQFVNTYIVLYTDDRTQEYIIEVDEVNKTFTPHLTEEQKDKPLVGFIEENLETIVASSSGVLVTILALFGIVVKVKKKVDGTLDVFAKNKKSSNEAVEAIVATVEELKTSKEETTLQMSTTKDDILLLTNKM